MDKIEEKVMDNQDEIEINNQDEDDRDGDIKKI